MSASGIASGKMSVSPDTYRNHREPKPNPTFDCRRNGLAKSLGVGEGWAVAERFFGGRADAGAPIVPHILWGTP